MTTKTITYNLGLVTSFDDAELPVDLTTHLLSLPSVSAQMRYLESEGYKRARIATILGKRYQHVKNVLDKPLKKNAD